MHSLGRAAAEGWSARGPPCCSASPVLDSSTGDDSGARDDVNARRSACQEIPRSNARFKDSWIRTGQFRPRLSHNNMPALRRRPVMARCVRPFGFDRAPAGARVAVSTKKRCTFMIEPDILDRLSSIAARTGLSKSEQIRQGIRWWLESREWPRRSIPPAQRVEEPARTGRSG